MHIAILFHHIGGYHAARLRAAHAVCQSQGWQLTAIQETDSAQEHPWGDLAQEISFPLETLLTRRDTIDGCDGVREAFQRKAFQGNRHPQSAVAASRLPACLKKLNPDVLMIPGWGYPNSRAALKWAKKHNRLAVLMSESKWDDKPRQWWKETLKSLQYVRHFKAALIGGQLHHDYLVKLGFSQSSLFLGYDIVDNAHFAQKAQKARETPLLIRRQQPDIPKNPYFIAVTRFIPRKNVLRLIDAYATYRSLGASQQTLIWDLVICGSGVEEQNIRHRISHHHLESSVHLPGFKTYQEMPQWFGLAKAFIHPALSEQWGLVVNEALAAGVPALVSNRCGCFSELIQEGINGFGFDPENVEELAQLMATVSDGSVDLNAISAAAQAHIKLFSPDTFGNGFKQAIECALSRS